MTLALLSPSRLRLPRLGRIERYVLIQQLRSLGVALAVISALVMLIDFVEVSRGVGSDQDLSALRILGLVALKSPSVIVQLLPFVFLFGTLAAYIGLNRRSELVAMRAAGVSAWRFVLPAAGMALVLGVLTVTVLGPLASATGCGSANGRASPEQPPAPVPTTPSGCARATTRGR